MKLALLLGVGIAAILTVSQTGSPSVKDEEEHSDTWAYRGRVDALEDCVVAGFRRSLRCWYRGGDGLYLGLWRGDLTTRPTGVPGLFRTEVKSIVASEYDRQWFLRIDGQDEPLTCSLTTVAMSGDGPVLHYTIELPEGNLALPRQIDVTERPYVLNSTQLDELYADMLGDPSSKWPYSEEDASVFAREFRFSSLPSEGQLALRWDRRVRSMTWTQGGTNVKFSQMEQGEQGELEALLLLVDSGVVVIQELVSN